MRIQINHHNTSFPVKVTYVFSKKSFLDYFLPSRRSCKKYAHFYYVEVKNKYHCSCSSKTSILEEEAAFLKLNGVPKFPSIDSLLRTLYVPGFLQ